MLYNADTFASFQLGTERDVFQALKQQLMARGDYTTFRWNRDLFFLLIDTFYGVGTTSSTMVHTTQGSTHSSAEFVAPRRRRRAPASPARE